ncbi:MAG: DUF4440 domain-containing protein [Pseudomonadota bacterium]
MEPALITDPKLLDVLKELMQREPIFHRPEFGTTRQDFEKMTEAAFWEVGASGRRYSREYILDLLEQRSENPIQDNWEAKDFHCTEIAADNYLITYTLLQGGRMTRRSTIWRRSGLDWKVVYHQGTVIID